MMADDGGYVLGIPPAPERATPAAKQLFGFGSERGIICVLHVNAGASVQHGMHFGVSGDRPEP